MVTALRRKLLRDIARMWPQLLAAALVMMVGIGALTMSLSTVTSLERAMEAYYQEYRFPDLFTHLKRAPRSLLPRLAEVPGVSRLLGRVSMDVTLDVPGMIEPATGRLVSITASPPYGLAELHLRRGRTPEPGRHGEAVVSEAFAEAHSLPLGAGVNAVINGRRETLTIVGIALSPEYIYQIRPGDFFPDDRRFGVFWMLEDQLAPAFNMEGAFNHLSVLLTPGANEPAVISAIDDLTRPYGGTGAYNRSDQTSHRYISDELDQLRGMARIPPVIFLSASAFILNIVFSRLIRTQREQVAVLKAFGYTGRQIASHYLQMVIVVALIGSAMGTLMGWRFGSYLTELYSRFFRFPVFEFSLDARAVAVAIAVGVGAAVLGTLISIRQASRLPPAEAMRPESPPDFRATIMERLRLHLVLRPVWRMVLRSLERQPVRSILTCIGIGLAIAVLVLGSFTHGAVNYLIEYSFSKVQRQDVTVTFVEPASPPASSAIGNLPGVIASEPFRAVPARLRAGHRSRREAVTGLVADPRLMRVLDEDARPVALPDHGVLLTQTLADSLEVGPGDRITIEVLEGQRPVVDLTVSGVVATYLGTAVYTNISTLNRLMGEPPVISGAFLSIDPETSPSLYRELKEAPRVSSVNIKRAALESFQQTLAENILRMRLFNLAFASIIAFGVIYNSARISLAERAHELATLRILGFTRAEVSVILLGELGVLTILAIPVGLAMGRVLTGIAVASLQTETHRIPFVINPGTYAFAVAVVLAAAFASGMVVRRGIDKLNLIEVLKTKG